MPARQAVRLALDGAVDVKASLARLLHGDRPVTLTRRRKGFALAAAAASDLAQMIFSPVFAEGGGSPFDVGLDAATALVILLIVGFEWRLAFALAVELIPGVDLFPTWTAVVVSMPTVPSPPPVLPEGKRPPTVPLALFALALACNPGNAARPAAKDAGHDASAAVTFTGFDVYVASANAGSVTRFFEFLPDAHATITTTANPADGATKAKGTRLPVAVVTDLACGECYRVSASGASYVVHGGNALGAQYGLAELLEATGVRFFHPWQSRVPAAFASPAGSPKLGVTHTPEMTLRGLHLHTLHTIESYFAFWASRASNAGAPDDAGDTAGADAGASGLTGLGGAKRVIDWIVKNRGNYVEWSALNDIVTADASDVATWRSHTSAILAYAHARGVKVGIGAELFGESNLQLSFDFLDDETDPNAKADVDARLHLLLDGLPWDIVDLSFGEFIGSDPDTFLTSVDLTYAELQKIAPGTTMAATIHVGSAPGLTVTYDGKQLLYYFLVQYADPHIVPWIHTVMYFDLFQPADGAYGIANFDQHRAYLEDRMKAGQPAAYYPESAYWISFDDSVPTYLPLYMRSRWLDITSLAAAAKAGGYSGLEGHVLFSSGWEWGYWQNDYATLRTSFEAPKAWTDPVNDMFAPWGATGAQLATLVGALGEVQNTYLIEKSLAPYVAGQDFVTALGAQAGIVAQPVRTSFAQVAAMSASDRKAFVASVVTPLGELDTATSQVRAEADLLDLDPTDPWLTETHDGIAMDADRVHYEVELWSAVDSFLDKGDDGGWLGKADATFKDAEAIAARRGARFHYPAPKLLTGPTSNSTSYTSGYLTEAATLCFWTRERAEADAVMGLLETVPTCEP